MPKILQLRINLEEIKPEIWRRFLIQDDISFEKLHNIVQEVMGWENYHLYEFHIGDVTITPEEEGYNVAESSLHKLTESPEFAKMLEQQDMSKGHASLDINKVNKILSNINKNKPENNFNINTTISKLIKSENQKFQYRYDFGDNWEHSIIVEKISKKEEAKSHSTCLYGKRACPPEDCGSVWGL
jgi:hypothetical protein|tara:strand:+ start:2695 stop:3249 length:555 start_codon:yes stop_codon:yes gene_type:complete